MADAGYFTAVAHNNAWANHRLVLACAALSQAEFEAERTGFFPSLKATLNHILVVDRFYVDALEGGRLGPEAWREEEPCPTAADLQREQGAMDRRLIALCQVMTAEKLTAPVCLVRADREQIESADRVLLHLFEHQIHHRGQAHCMLAGTNAAPPQLDEFFLAEDAPLRADDFAELDIDEAKVWGDAPNKI